MAIDIKLSKAQIKKIIPSGGFLGKLLSKLVGPLMKAALPLAKNVLAPLGLTAAIDGSIQKKIHGSGVTLTIEEEDMKDIMKIIEALENSGILLKGVSKTIENETKEQRGGFLSMLLGTLGASLLGNLLSGGKGILRAGEGIVRNYYERSIYWNEYKTKEINENADPNVFKYINLDPLFQGVNRLLVMAYSRADGQPTRNGRKKYYLPRIDLKKYNVIIDGRNFYDNPIESDIEKYRELKKVMI